MTYDLWGRVGLDYDICTYDGSRLQFRGPAQDLSKPYVAFLGTTETFGKFVARPFPDLLAPHLPAKPVNLGLINGGIDAYLNDPGVLELARGAELCVLQVIGALNLSNHYFKVHPRRNDRFICAEEPLKRLYPEVDFTEFHFTRAMLARLQRSSDRRYRMICDELQKIWLARMTVLLKLLGDRVLLLWFAAQQPPQDAVSVPDNPLLIDADMIERMRKLCRAYVQIVPDKDALERDKAHLTELTMQGAMAASLMGPAAHLQAAQGLQETCNHLLK